MSLFDLLKSPATKDASGLPAIDAATARRWHGDEGCVFVDIREEAEFRAEHISGAQLAPLSRLEQALAEKSKTAKTVFYCLGGTRTQANAARLAGCGIADAYLLAGGIRAWKAEGGPTE
jgi:rhodanese-related sulfurtransferase